MVQVLWPTCQVPWPMPVTVFSPGQLQGRVPCSPHLHLPHLQLSYRGGPGMAHTGTPWLVHTLAVLLWWPQHGLSLLHLQLAVRVAPVWYAPGIYQLTSASAPVILSRGLSASHPRTPWSAYSSSNCPAEVALVCAETLLIFTCSSSTSLSKATLNVCPKTLLSAHFRTRQSAKVACCMQSTQKTFLHKATEEALSSLFQVPIQYCLIF